MLEDGVCIRMLLQHDDAPAHCSRDVRDDLNKVCPNKSIERNGPERWTARSPELTKLDLLFRGYIKKYSLRPTTF